MGFDASDRASDALGLSPTTGPRTASPGKRTRTEALQRTARATPSASPGPAAAASPVTADVDPFALHLGAGEALPAAERAAMEKSFGVDLSAVRVHDDDAAHAAAAALEARAFANGNDVVFGAGQRADGGAALLAHEVAHVVASGGARGATVATDDAHEAAADDAAAAVTAGRSVAIGPAPAAVRRSPLPQALHQPMARLHLFATDSLPAVDGVLRAEAELVPSGQAPEGFAGYASAFEARQRALQSVDEYADEPVVHATVVVRDGDGRYHVFDTGRRPLAGSDGAAPRYAISTLSGAGWTVEQVVRFSRDEAATQTGAAQLPVLDPQQGPTCGAASLVAFVVAEDARRGGPDHSVLVAACDHVVRYASARRASLARTTPPSRSRRGAAQVEHLLAEVGHARALAAAGDVNGAARALAQHTYDLFRAASSSGMIDSEAQEVSAALGIDGGAGTDDRPSGDVVTSFDSLFTNRVVQTLAPGEAAQVSWLAGRSPWGRHYFLIGRRVDGAAYFYDQATQFQRAAANVDELRRALSGAAALGEVDYFPPGRDPSAIGSAGFGFSARRLRANEI